MEIIIQKEREKSQLSPEKLASNLYGHEYSLNMKSYLQAAPTLSHTPNLFNKSRLQLIKDAYRYMALTYNYNHNHKNKDTHPHFSTIYEILVSPSAVPAFAHCVMFIKYIQLMCNDKQKQLYLQKAIKYQIVGCYAQTELGHGSDIKGLQTTAQYDVITKQWIIDSPSVSSAKYWPGELSFLANYAIVFAQTIIKGKNYGVHPFLVNIRDENYNCLPGIEGGDIGPKLGFHAKQNGYMYFRSIRIPRQNLFTKYVQVSQGGQYKKIGDSRIGYATMLSVRQLISCATTIGYPVVITIGARYALFRRQFMNDNKEQITIMEYQTQQDKIISRIAEYYAIRIAGNKISQIGQDNGRNVRDNDFSLLQETHSNLAFSKSLFSQIISEGGEIIRRSLGGHGTSYYSGVPQIMNELAANNTLQGQNTVMYIQTALYVLKNYSNYMRNVKSLQHSVEYINRFGQLTDMRFDGKQEWKTIELRDAMIKTINYLVELIVSRLMNKQQGEDQKIIINKVVGLRLQQLAQIHGVLFMVNQMLNTINKEFQQDIKQVLDHLCQLFATNQMQRLALPIIEAGFISPLRWTQLSLQKQVLLKILRPHVAILLDSFLIPQKFIKSQLTHGNPYQNYLNRARECEINVCVSKAAKEVGKIRNILSAKPRM